MLKLIRSFLARRREQRIRRAWAKWYAAHPCKASHLMPWDDKEYS